MSAVGQSLVIGTYTRREESCDGRPSGILAASYEGTSVAGLTALAELPNPSWVTATADGGYLYAVAETADFAGRPGGGVAAYARDPTAGAVMLLNAVSSGGAAPAHLELDPSERFVIVANYDSGSVSVFAREASGRLGAMTCHVQHQGSSVHPVRQASPHPHQICFDPVTGDLFVPDLGIDAVLSYRLSEDGILSELPGGAHHRIARRRTPAPRVPPRRPAPIRRQRAGQHAGRVAPRRRRVHPDRCHLHGAGRLHRPEPGQRRPGLAIRTIGTGRQPRPRQHRRARLRPGHREAHAHARGALRRSPATRLRHHPRRCPSSSRQPAKRHSSAVRLR